MLLWYYCYSFSWHCSMLMAWRSEVLPLYFSLIFIIHKSNVWTLINDIILFDECLHFWRYTDIAVQLQVWNHHLEHSVCTGYWLFTTPLSRQSMRSNHQKLSKLSAYLYLICMYPLQLAYVFSYRFCHEVVVMLSSAVPINIWYSLPPCCS